MDRLTGNEWLGPGIRLGFEQPVLALAGCGIATLALAAALLAGDGRRVAALRGVVLLLVGLALGRPMLSRTSGPDTAVAIDVSRSVDAEAATIFGTTLEAAAASGVPRLRFGGSARSDLSAAIEDGAALLPRGGSLLLATDGRDTGHGSLEAAARASRLGVRVDVVVLESAMDGLRDVAIVALDVPAGLRAGDRASAAVTLRSTESASATLELRHRGGVAMRELSLPAGEASYAIAFDVPEVRGALEMEAVIAAEGDAVPENDSAWMSTVVLRAPRVLVVGEGEPAVAAAETLVEERLEVDVRGPGALPADRGGLVAYDAVLLVDVPAESLTIDRLAALEDHVARGGAGLLLSAGPRSFLLGGWRDTPLEAMSPLRLEPPKRDERPAVALLMMIDRSASMAGGDSRSPLSKLDLARIAAGVAADELETDDIVGVVTYDETARWDLPLQRLQSVSPGGLVGAALEQVEPDGGTRILSALELGMPALARSEAEIKHAVLLSDGRDMPEDREAMLAEVSAALERGATLSAIAIGLDADADLLGALARAGRGRFERAATPGELPHLALAEGERVRAGVEQRGEYRAVLPSSEDAPASAPHAHRWLSGLDIVGLPTLTGYLGLSRRDQSTVILEIGAGDPLLAQWRFGAGNVTAWTSDVGGPWTRAWRSDPAARALLARIVRASARPPGALLETDLEPLGSAGRWRLRVARVGAGSSAIAETAVSPLMAEVVVTGTDGVELRTDMRMGPGGAVASDLDVGSMSDWVGSVSVPVHIGGASPMVVAPLRQLGPISRELQPSPKAREHLEAIAAAGGGELYGDVETAFGASGWAPDSLSEQDSGLGADRPRDATRAVARRGGDLPLWPGLLVLAAVLWPLDVALHTRLRARRSRAEHGLGAPPDQRPGGIGPHDGER